MIKGVGDKPYKLAVLRDRKKDLSKKWYIEFYAWSEVEQELIRKQIYIPASYQTVKARQAYARTEIRTINDLLQSGCYFGSEAETVPVSLRLVDSLGSMLEGIRVTLRPKSYITYKSALNKLSEYVPDDVELNALQRKFAYLFRDYLLNEKGNSARTANNNIEFLRVLYNRLAERETVPANPFQLKPLKTGATTKNIAFTAEHQILVENYLRDNEPELYLFTRFLYYGFIRPGELLSLKGCHLDRERMFIRVPGEISKNGQTETIPILRPLLAEIGTKVFPDEKFLFGFDLKPGNYKSGKQVPFRRHEKILDSLGLKEYHYTLYSWRHTGAVNAYLSGVGLKQLQALFRHSSVSVTDNYLKSLGLRTDPNLNDYDW
jgi:integrase/recombinase XerC